MITRVTKWDVSSMSQMTASPETKPDIAVQPTAGVKHFERDVTCRDNVGVPELDRSYARWV